jgi:hypothetical protein
MKRKTKPYWRLFSKSKINNFPLHDKLFIIEFVNDKKKHYVLK